MQGKTVFLTGLGSFAGKISFAVVSLQSCGILRHWKIAYGIR